jgi:hypothetical protein
MGIYFSEPFSFHASNLLFITTSDWSIESNCHFILLLQITVTLTCRISS